MDKRLSIALLLTALVVAVTPILFPTPKKTPVTVGREGRDTIVSSTVPPAVASSAISGSTVANGSVKQLAPQAPSPGALSPVDSVVPAQEQVATVNTAKATYRFTNIGASPMSITMGDYKNLATKKGNVDLHATSGPLLDFAIVARKDTVKLDRVPFQAAQSSSGGVQQLTYRARIAGMDVSISYVIEPSHYLVHVTGQVTGAPSPAYLLIGLPPSLPATETDTLVDLRALAFSFKPQRDNARGVPFGKLDPGEKRFEPGPLTWTAVKNKYFVVGLINPEGSAFEEMTLTGGMRTTKLATNAAATVVKAVKNDAFAFDMYAGPQQSAELLSVGRDFDHVNPYGWSFLQPVVNPIAALCIELLLWMHAHLKLSYGWVLIIFGICIRVVLWPLNQSAMRSSMKMQEIQPRLADVQKRYKDNPEKQREEMMKVYKEAGASPFTALSGCLPMLIPMPVLFALFFVFQNTIEFRGVPFLWLLDISVRDPFFILPVLMGISMYLLSWIGMRNAPPNPQAKMMSYMFPVMMTFILANMASGLNLYYTAQNMASLPQQWLLARERAKTRRPA